MALEAAQFQSDQLSKRAMTYMIKNPHARFWVLLDKGVLQGYAIVLEHSRAKAARLYSIALDGAFQGTGLGDQLMTQLESACRKAIIRLEVRCDNVRAQRFYQRRDYIKTGERSHFYTDGMSAILMQKRLT